MRRTGLGCLIAAVFALVFGPVAGAERTAGMLPQYNAERVGNGLPPVSVVNPQMEAGCANHDRYLQLNHLLEHGEDPAKPGYTPEGNSQNGAGGGEVLSQMPGWSAGFDPWSTAPIHLYLMFDPSVFQVGYADGFGFACMRVRGQDAPPPVTAPVQLPGTNTVILNGPVPTSAPVAPAFFAWTGDSGHKGVPYFEHAAESPYVPQQLVGIPASRTTGPNILLYSAGDAGVPVAATLTGPGGAIATKMVNVNTRNSVGDGGWFTGGGVLIPVRPLKPATTYSATVQWDDAGPQTQTFDFTTAPKLRANPMVFMPRADRSQHWRMTVATPAPHPLVVLTGPKGQTLQPKVTRSTTPWMKLARGQWTACAVSGSWASGYQPRSACVNLLAGP